MPSVAAPAPVALVIETGEAESALEVDALIVVEASIEGAATEVVEEVVAGAVGNDVAEIADEVTAEIETVVFEAVPDEIEVVDEIAVVLEDAAADVTAVEALVEDEAVVEGFTIEAGTPVTGFADVAIADFDDIVGDEPVIEPTAEFVSATVEAAALEELEEVEDELPNLLVDLRPEDTTTDHGPEVELAEVASELPEAVSEIIAEGTASLTEAVDDLVADAPELPARDATGTTEVSVDPAPVEPEAEEALTSEVDRATTTVSERLDQVLMGSPSIPSSEVLDEPVELAGTDAVGEFFELGESSEALTSAPVTSDAMEEDVDSEDEDASSSSIPPWPGTADAGAKRTPLSASDAPPPPTLPNESDRSGGRTNPSRFGPPSNPSGAPFRPVGDRLPSRRSWPTLPR